MSRFVVLATALALPFASAASGPNAAAQTVQAASATIPVVPSSTARPVERVSVDFRNVALADALQVLADRSGADITFVAQRLPARLVTYRGRDVSVQEALAAILDGTGVHVTRGRDGAFKLDTEKAAQGVLIGKVVSAKTKLPISGATVTVDNDTKGIRTDADGQFRLPGVVVGSHTVFVRAVGYTRAQRQITVKEDGTVALNIELEPSASVLDEVVVTGTVVATQRREITTPITVITADELEKRNITRIEQLFRGEVPGVVALDLGTASWQSDNPWNAQQSRVFARGASGLDNGTATPIKTYVDGIELLDPTYLGTIDPRSIERIEIIAGPQAATIYGSGAMGGVMQIFTKKGTNGGKPDLTLNVRYGALQSNLNNNYTPSHNHSLLINGGSGPEFSYSATGSYGYTGQWQPGLWARNLGASAGMTHRRGIVQVGATASLTQGQNGTYGAPSNYGGPVFLGSGAAAYSLFTRTLTENGDLPADFGAAGFFESKIARSLSQNLSLDINVRPLPNWQHQLTVGRVVNDFNMDPEKPTLKTPADSFFRRNWSEGARQTVNYNTTFAPRLGVMAATLTLGGSYSAGKQVTYLGCTTTGQDGNDNWVNCGGYQGPIVRSSVGDQNDRNWGGFGLARVGFFDQLYFSFGMRGERTLTYGSDHPVDWTPTYGVTYTFEVGALTVKALASYGTATRAPSLDKVITRYNITTYSTPSMYAYQLANPDLVPERSHGPQGGFEVSYGNLGAFTINRYDQRVVDLLMQVPADSLQVVYSWDPTPYWYVQQMWANVGAVRQHGWEATGTLNLGPVAVKGAYSLAEARTLSVSPLGKYYWNSVPGVGQGRLGVPSHSGSFNVSYAHGPTSVSWTGNYVGSSSQPLTSFEGFIDPLVRLQMYRLRVKSWDLRGTTPGYLKHDLAATHRLSNRTSFLLNMTNVTDDNSSDATALLPSLGRQTQFGLSIRFL